MTTHHIHYPHPNTMMLSTTSIIIILVSIVFAFTSYRRSEPFTNIRRSGRALQSNENKIKEGSNIVVVLGSDNNDLLQDRMNIALDKVKDIEGDIIWYLTGGVKRYNDKGGEMITEASKMLYMLKMEGNTNAVIIDDKAKNTAENFVKLKGWLDHINEDVNIHIVTSAFHFIRAKSMFEEIMPNIQATWELGYKSCSTCLSDELIHRQHVKKDVERAFENEMNLYNRNYRFRRGHTLDTIDEYTKEEFDDHINNM